MRLFLALDLPVDVRGALARWGAAELGDGLRQIAAEDLHLTLVFLGWRAAEQVEEIWSAVCSAIEGLSPPRLEPGPVVGVPRRRPRLVALELADPDGAAGAWQREVSGALVAAGLYEPERRPFWPHVTLARGRRGARLRAPASAPQLSPFQARPLTLYRSDLSPAGARYRALETSAGEPR